MPSSLDGTSEPISRVISVDIPVSEEPDVAHEEIDRIEAGPRCRCHSPSAT